ncbi:hypothetical protein Desor_5178 [Desulfosporosinus orientis DSM 765]|uniref:Uncharacterized protein n=1 Tax=Desulfosporosinus orientis (strain ATCC 19365 / DSM 765 / NCIMB 8382 / VKM B-1628 / Singapore I) TaxID=768706 RepID=G7W758_DESOD|nr:hypothetical protein [Desulfosporosinus orientis]AET70566.1 hypothetical protein Desor_5178 [Desulfosporosinus orientis DSM 765]
MKFVLIYLVALSLVLLFNYGAHAKERELGEEKREGEEKDKLLFKEFPNQTSFACGSKP